MKRFLFMAILIVSLVIIRNLVTSIYNLWQKQYLIVSAQKELEVEKKKSLELKKKLVYAESTAFIEEQARNKLFLSKPGEKEIILSNISKSDNSSKNKENDPNWKKWWELFFH